MVLVFEGRSDDCRYNRVSKAIKLALPLIPRTCSRGYELN